jgi:protein-S-isoprenylcysteine O-methyltransferase Ste14
VNPFFEPGVRIQTERGHRVVDTGPYAIIRHPGYVAASFMFAGFALSLGSWWVLIPAGFGSLVRCCERSGRIGPCMQNCRDTRLTLDGFAFD